MKKIVAIASADLVLDSQTASSLRLRYLRPTGTRILRYIMSNIDTSLYIYVYTSTCIFMSTLQRDPPLLLEDCD